MLTYAQFQEKNNWDLFNHILEKDQQDGHLCSLIYFN